MLTSTTPARRLRVLLALLTTAAAVGLVTITTSAPAAADPPTCTAPDGTTYVCTQPGTPPGEGTGGDDDSGGGGSTVPAAPTCVLHGQFTFCIGTRACRMIDWHPPFKQPEGPKPSPDSVPLIRECNLGDPALLGPYPIEIYWSDDGEPQPPSLAVQAQTAIGQLDLSLPALRTSPDDRTLVNLPTWYWLDGAPGVQVGSSAFGLRAIATVSGIDVAPGDGGALDCPVTTSSAQAEQSCTHTYTRESNDGQADYEGRPAYVVSATSTWNLRFEYNGVPVANIPGAPATLVGPASTAELRVDQVQSVVTGSD